MPHHAGEGGVTPSGVTPMGGEGVTPTPANPQAIEYYDLEDFLTDLAYPTTGLVKVEVHPDGTVSYDLPRTEVGQGIDTAIGMLIAEEMELPLEKVKVPLSDAKPELLFNMFTGGSNTINSLYYPVRAAAAAAKNALVEAAAAHLGYGTDQVTARGGNIPPRTARACPTGSWPPRLPSRRRGPWRSSSRPNPPSPSSGSPPSGSTPWTS